MTAARSQHRLLRLLPALAVIIMLLLAAGFVYLLKNWLADNHQADRKKIVQQVTILTPPPPPPPEEKPPEPEVEEDMEPEPEKPPAVIWVWTRMVAVAATALVWWAEKAAGVCSMAVRSPGTRA